MTKVKCDYSVCDHNTDGVCQKEELHLEEIHDVASCLEDCEIEGE